MSKNINQSNIFERLADAQTFKKKVDQLNNVNLESKKKLDDQELKLSELNQKVGMVQDIMQGKAKQEDLQAFNLKLHDEIEQLKKQLNVSEEVQKSAEEMKKSFVDLEHYNKTISDIGICLEKYIVCNEDSNGIIQNECECKNICESLEKRLKKLEQLQAVKNQLPKTQQTPRVSIAGIRSASTASVRK